MFYIDKTFCSSYMKMALGTPPTHRIIDYQLHGLYHGLEVEEYMQDDTVK